MRTIHRTLIAAATLALAVGACKKAPPAAEPAPPPPAPLAVAGVTLGKAVDAMKAVSMPATTFGVRDTIYASVATTGVATSATLTAHWTFENGQTVDSTSQSIAPSGPANTEFHIMKASPWPAGKYTVSIMLNGAAASAKAFEVR
jgi:hypothetical protein